MLRCTVSSTEIAKQWSCLGVNEITCIKYWLAHDHARGIKYGMLDVVVSRNLIVVVKAGLLRSRE